jgi:hypothetical protein
MYASRVSFEISLQVKSAVAYIACEASVMLSIEVITGVGKYVDFKRTDCSAYMNMPFVGKVSVHPKSGQMNVGDMGVEVDGVKCSAVLRGSFTSLAPTASSTTLDFDKENLAPF